MVGLRVPGHTAVPCLMAKWMVTTNVIISEGEHKKSVSRKLFVNAVSRVEESVYRKEEQALCS